MSKQTNEPSTSLTVGDRANPVRFSFLTVHTAKLPKNAKPSDKPKFSVQIIVAKKSPFVAKIDAAMRLAASTSKATKALDYDTLDLILRDGDDPKQNKKKAEHLKGHYFFNASCGEEYPPQVVGTKIDPMTGKLERLGKKDIKSGDFGAVSVNFYGYDTNGNQGIAAGLRNVQKLRDGDSLAGSTEADDDFEADADDDLLK